MKFLNYIFGIRDKKPSKTEKVSFEIQQDSQKEFTVDDEYMQGLKSCDLESYYKNKEIIDIVFNVLKTENIDANMNLYSIHYEANDKDDHEIKLDNISLNENKLAWFQTSFNDKHLLRVFENKTNFNWEPTTHNPVFGCDCYLIEWYNEYLIFIYKEKHYTYICSIKNQEVKTFHFHGVELEKENEIIYFLEYGPKKEYVRRIRIPDLVELEPILIIELEKKNLVPKYTDPLENYLKNK